MNTALPFAKELSAVLVCFGLLTASASAQVLFNDNFDGSPYTDNGTFNPANHTLTAGYWQLDNTANGTETTSTATSLSPNRSLALTNSASGDKAEVVGQFSTNAGTSTPTTSAITVQLAFNLGDTATNSGLGIAIRDSGNQDLGLIELGSGSTLDAFFTSSDTSLGTIAANTWYNLDFSMSANPGTGTEMYTVTLLAADDTTQLGQASGTFFVIPTVPSSENYASLTLSNNGFSSQTTPYSDYFDNVNVAVQAAPEPGTFALLFLGIGSLLVGLRYQKQRSASGFNA